MVNKRGGVLVLKGLTVWWRITVWGRGQGKTSVPSSRDNMYVNMVLWGHGSRLSEANIVKRRDEKKIRIIKGGQGASLWGYIL